jgi:hypothetical protein
LNRLTLFLVSAFVPSADARPARPPPSIQRSTVEYGAEEEHLQKGRRWDRTVGAYLIAEYRVVEQFETVPVMAREGTGVPSD